MEELLSNQYENNTNTLNRQLHLDKSFDIVAKKLQIGGRKASLYFVDGLIKDDVMEKILEFLLSADGQKLSLCNTPESFCDSFIPYVETELCPVPATVATQVLSGTLALLVEGFSSCIMIDARTYPVRGVQEPEDDKVLRGSRDGFVETLVFNTALIRRRIRDPMLTMEYTQIGTVSKTDVVLCYMENKVDREFLEKLRAKLKTISVRTLSMGQESLAECLIPKQWYNPFPRVRYTERPDCAAACVAEGKIIVIIDNSPAVMLLPSSFFDFVQDTNDFYFPPMVGTYLRIVRIVVFFLTLFLTPVWYLLIQNPDSIPSWLSFIKIEEPNSVPVILQLLIIEFVIDGLKLASLNTPSVLNNSFSVVGALILGDFAVQANWFVPEVVLYMAFVAIANFAQPSFELGYAFKLSRVFILIATALFNYWGFFGGFALICLLIMTTRTISGRNYLYPLIPFRPAEFARLFVRKPIDRKNT